MSDGYTPYWPHPLVAAIGATLAESGSLSAPAQQLASALAEGRIPEGEDYDAAAELAKVLAQQTDVPDLAVLTGYLGAEVEQNGTWRLLYDDSRLQAWKLIRAEDCKLHCRLTDNAAPYGFRDQIWVERGATIVRGDVKPTPEEVARRILRGDFTFARDMSGDAVGGGLLGPLSSPSTGPFCEAVTPYGGCTRKSMTSG